MLTRKDKFVKKNGAMLRCHGDLTDYISAST